MNPTPSSTSAFPYTNPYTNPYTQRRTTKPASSSSSLSPYTNAAQQQWEQSLEILVRSTVVPPAQTVERLYGSLQKAQEQSTPDDQFCWNLEMARSFVTYCIRMFGCHENINMTGRNPEGYPCILSFLARALEDWSFDDSIMYQVIVEEFQVELEEHRGSRTSSQQNKTLTMSLLQLLHNLAVNFHDPIIRDPAVAGLSITWRYLDRIYFLTSWRNHHSSLTTSIDAAWWMPVTNELSLANMALQELLKEERRDFPKVYMFPTSIEMRISWTSVLFCFLKHDRVGWLHKLGSQTKKVLNDLSRELLDQAGKLSDSNNQMQHNIHLALASVSLLLLMDSKEKLDISNEFNQYVYSTKLIESAFRSYFHMFGASSPSGSRWTYEHKDKITQRWAEECIYAWSLSKEEVTCKMAFDAIENHWRQPVEDLFLSLVSDSPDKHINDIQSQTGRQINHHKRNKELFSRLLLLYSVHHESVRSILGRILSRTSTCDNRSVDFLAQPCHKLVQSLIFYSTQGVSRWKTKTWETSSSLRLISPESFLA